MSAAAVEAVRPGLRTALAPARSPATPPARRAGQPTTRASGLTRLGASSAMPMNSPSTPRTSRRAMRAPAPLANMPARERRERREEHDEPVLAECAAKLGPEASSPRGPRRSAARGSPARAGRMLASSVTRCRRCIDTVTVCGRSRCWPRAGRRPARSNRASMPLAMPIPDDQPDHRRDQADGEAFEDDRAHDLLARGAERPQRGELACALGDRDRQRVEDHEARRRAARCRRSRAGPGGSSSCRR